MGIMSVGDRNQYRDIQCCHLRGRPHSKLPIPVVVCGCCGCCAGVVGACTSWGAELERTCGDGGGGCLGEDGEDEGDEEKFLGASIGGGEGGRGLGCGWSSGIGILLRCTVRLDGGAYLFAEGSSSLMRCSPTEGLLSCITYWCSSSDSFPELTSAEIMRDVRREVGNGAKRSERRMGWSWSTHHVYVSSASRAQLLARPLVRRRMRRSER